MTTNHTVKRAIVGTLLSAGVAVAGLGLSAGTAQAATGAAPQSSGAALAYGQPAPQRICWALFLPGPCPRSARP